MPNKDALVVGFNHMFLYPESMTDGQAHTQTLQQLAQMPRPDALDCWVWAANAKQELAILRSCGKKINYNIGDRPGERPVFPATADKAERAYALDILRRETEFAIECGAQKIVFGSGKDVPEAREEAIKRFEDFVLTWSSYIPKQMWLTLEPTDRDVDKRFLFGDMAQTHQTVARLRRAGMQNMGILLDMGHVPLMHHSLAQAATLGGDLLEHIHLGNCVIQNPADPFYGDKHPCWGYPGGAYTQADGAYFLKQLQRVGYFSTGRARTVSFEMRPLQEKSARQTVELLANWIQTVYTAMAL